MLKKENGTAPTHGAARSFRTEFVDSTLDTLFKTVADADTKEKSGWDYGATFDTLSPADFSYGITDPNNSTIFIPYFQANQSINGADLPFREKDMVLGISLNQHNTLLSGGTMDDVRVLYLDPATFGSTSVGATAGSIKDGGTYNSLDERSFIRHKTGLRGGDTLTNTGVETFTNTYHHYQPWTSPHKNSVIGMSHPSAMFNVPQNWSGHMDRFSNDPMAWT